MTIDLYALLAPLSIGDLRAVWGKQSLLVRGSKHKADAALTSTFGELAARAIGARLKTTRMGPGGRASPTRAFKRIGPSHALHVLDAHTIDVGLGSLTRSAKEELGYAGAVCAECTLARPGFVLPLHRDGYGVLTLQIAGKACWQLSARPAERWSRERAVAQRGDRPALHDCILAPGDLAYWPAGTWHSQRVVGNASSLSVAITFEEATFARVLGGALDAIFAHRASWRHHPPGEVDMDFVNARLAELRSLLDAAARDPRRARAIAFEVDRSRARMVTEHDGALPPARRRSRTLGAGVSLAFSSLGPRSYVAGKDRRGRASLTLFAGPYEATFDDLELLPFARRLAQAPRSFSLEEALSWGEARRVRPILKALVDAGILEVEAAPRTTS